MIEVENQVFLSWEFTAPSVHDTLVLPTLLDRLDIKLGDVHADAGYLSSRNIQYIVSQGGTPYVRPKSNTRGRPAPREKDPPSGRTSEEFRTMIDAYRRDETNWLRTYHRRNSIESAWSGVKRRFHGIVAAVTDRMRRVEAALKLVAWNITRVTRRGRRN